MDADGADASDGFLAAYLAQNDAACPGCGYNLRGLTGRICPECAQSLRLLVALDEPKLGLWITGLIGTAAGAGFSGLLLLYIIVVMTLEGRNRGGGFIFAFVAINFGGLVVQGSVLALWLRLRRRFRLLSRPGRIAWALAAWALTLADLALFTVAIK